VAATTVAVVGAVGAGVIGLVRSRRARAGDLDAAESSPESTPSHAGYRPLAD